MGSAVVPRNGLKAPKMRSEEEWSGIHAVDFFWRQTFFEKNSVPVDK